MNPVGEIELEQAVGHEQLSARQRLTSSPLARFLARRFGRIVISVWLLVTAAFAVVRLVPGDPVTASLGPLATAQQVVQRREQLGLNHSLTSQYWTYLVRLLHGNLGESTSTGFPVSRVIGDRLAASVQLGSIAFIVVIVVSIPLGMAAAALTFKETRRVTELSFVGVTGMISSIPGFLLAVGLVYVFAVTFSLVPPGGKAGASSFVLPVIALASAPTAALARIVRVEALNVLSQDYMRTARAKRVPARLFYLRHALPNLLTAALTIGGLLLTDLLGGSVLVENIFAWPGLGQGIVNAIEQKDYPLVQSFVLIYGVAVLVIITVVDILLATFDPRSTILET